MNKGDESEDAIVSRAQLLVDYWQHALQLKGG